MQTWFRAFRVRVAARLVAFRFISFRSACGPRRRAAQLVAFRCFWLTARLLCGAGPVLKRQRRLFVPRARENPAFGCEMLLGCTVQLAHGCQQDFVVSCFGEE